MSSLKRLISLTVVLVLASCTDSTGPRFEDTGQEPVPLLSRPANPGAKGDDGGRGSGDPASFVLRHSAEAPPLESYELSFWAVKGQKAQVDVFYSAPLSEGDTSTAPRFLKFEVPARGLKARPDGSALVNGDSVLITLTIDPTEFRIDFEPSGLVFDKRSPAVLKVDYKAADRDLDRDGDVDADDDAILRAALGGFHYDDVLLPWKLVPSENSTVSMSISVEVLGFSGYAISW